MERGKELRDLGIQSVQRIWWPRNFAAGFAMPPAVSGDAEEPPIASIKRTVCICAASTPRSCHRLGSLLMTLRMVALLIMSLRQIMIYSKLVQCFIQS